MAEQTHDNETRFTRLLIAGLILCVLAPSLLWVAIPGNEWTQSSLYRGVSHGLGVLNRTDSFFAMETALDHIHSDHPEPLYTELVFNRHMKFQYPVTSLLPLDVLRRLFDDRSQVLSAFSVVCLLFFLVTAIACVLIFRERADTSAANVPQAQRWKTRPIQLALFFVFAMFFYSNIKAYENGQLQIWVTGLASVGLLAWLRGHDTLSGVSVGLACLLKPQCLPFLAWALLRKHWGFFNAALVTVAGGVGLSLLLYGARTDYPGYFATLSFLSRHGEVYYPNQSVNGILNRLLENGNWAAFSHVEYAAYHPVVYGASLLTGLLILGGVILRRAKGNEARIRNTEFCLILLGATLASPIAWEHHYGILVPVYAYLIPILLLRSPSSRMQTIALGLAVALSANAFIPGDVLKASAWFGKVYAFLFVGAAIVLAFLFRLRREQSPTAQRRQVAETSTHPQPVES